MIIFLQWPKTNLDFHSPTPSHLNRSQTVHLAGANQMALIYNETVSDGQSFTPRTTAECSLLANSLIVRGSGSAKRSGQFVAPEPQSTYSAFPP
jgi:hypothetical protein